MFLLNPIRHIHKMLLSDACFIFMIVFRFNCKTQDTADHAGDQRPQCVLALSAIPLGDQASFLSSKANARVHSLNKKKPT